MIFKNKKILASIFGIVFFVLGIWLFQAPKAEVAASEYKFIDIYLDTDSGFPSVCYTGLWQFHGISSLSSPHTNDYGAMGSDILNLPANPTPRAGYQCGIWVVEDDTFDKSYILWAQKGRKLSKSGTSLVADLGAKGTNWDWCTSCIMGGPAGDCVLDKTPPSTTMCDSNLTDGSGADGLITHPYGDMGCKTATAADYAFSVGGATKTYRPKFDILCAGSNLWKTCEANDCAVIGANSWACNGGTGEWKDCTAIAEVCNGAGACAPPGAVEICNNGVDDGDPDLLADCADTADCPAGTACIEGGICDGTGSCVGGGGGGGGGGGVGGGGGGITFLNPSKINDFMELVDSLINALFYIAIPLAILMLVIAAFLFMTTGGEAQKVNTARTLVFYTLLGLLIIVLAKAISAAVKYAVS